MRSAALLLLLVAQAPAVAHAPRATHGPTLADCCQVPAAEKGACCAQRPLPEVSVPDSCPVTLVPETPFVPRPPQPETAPFHGTWYGSERLWTVLTRGGALGRNNKSWWWSENWDSRHDMRPALTVTARRIRGTGKDEDFVRASRATNAHAADIGHAMLAGLAFPTGGCWEVTGEYEGATLSFVAWVP